MKFKNIKQKKRKSASPVRKPAKKVGESGKKRQFPSISRFITERWASVRAIKLTFSLSRQSKLYKITMAILATVIFVIIVVLTAGISFFAVKTYQNYGKITQINTQRQNIQGKINFWQSIADKYDGYKDAYFQMAILDYTLGNFQKAKNENEKALLLDPNFNDAKKLEVILDKQ
jgi:tetratricopeptide (TPR) repeat protein